jgi:trehalose 6-phosphate phosphatase
MGLPTPSSAAGRTGLAALLERPGEALLGLDFDGTLAPIVPDPDEARAHPDVPPALARLAPRLGRVAVITGRPAEIAVDYASLADIDRLVVLGHYGLERWEGGRVIAPPDDPAIAAARTRVPMLLTELGVADAYVEDKGRAIAVHVRRTADPRATFDLVAPRLRALADELGLAVEPGRMVVELRPAGGDKGDALRSLVAEQPPSAVVFIGDDLGDLPAFAAVETLRGAGVPGLLVGSGSTEVTEVAERADLVVDGPSGVAALLQALADELDRRAG